MSKFIIMALIALLTPCLFAYIPSSKMILDKLVENNIAGPIFYEQEVLINGNGTNAAIKESWYVENENTMSVLVQGEKSLKDKVQFTIQYNGKKKTAPQNLIKNNEVSSFDFFEPIFFMKSQQKLIPYIVGAGIVGAEIQESSNFQKQKETFVHTPESFVRLGRTAGVVAYVIGGTNGIEAGQPGFWIEQDQFLIRKIRNSRRTEMNIEKWGSYSKGWKLPKERSFAWDDKTAQVKMLDVKVPQGNLKSMITKAQEIKSSEYENSKEKALIEDFYLRLR